MDRGSLRAWQEGGSRDAYARARSEVARIVASAADRPLAARADVAAELVARVASDLRRMGFDALPGVPGVLAATPA